MWSKSTNTSSSATSLIDYKDSGSRSPSNLSSNRPEPIFEGVLPMKGISEDQGKRKKTRPPRGAARRSNCPHPHSHPFEIRRKAAQLCLEESFPVEQVAREMGVGQSTLSKWVRLYRDEREAGLKSKPPGRGRPKEVSHHPLRQWTNLRAKVCALPLTLSRRERSQPLSHRALRVARRAA